MSNKKDEIQINDTPQSIVMNITDLMLQFFKRLTNYQEIVELASVNKVFYAAVTQYNLLLFQILFKSAYEKIPKFSDRYQDDYKQLTELN